MTTPDIERLRAGLEAAIRAAKLALFVVKKQNVMPNSSWEGGFEKDLAIAQAALEAALQPAVGGGWKMVPVEPTEEMQIAGFQAWEATCFRSDVSQGDDIYKAMLAASPAIQEQKP